MVDLYYTSIHNNYVSELSKDINISTVFTLEQIIDSPLWLVEKYDSVYRCYPLFNCEYLSCSVSEVSILDEGYDKCLIFHTGLNRSNVYVYVHSTSDPYFDNKEDIVLFAYAYNTRQISSLMNSLSVFCNVTDSNANPVNGETILIQVSTDEVTWSTVQTSESVNGSASYTVKQVDNDLYLRFSNIDESIISNTIHLTSISKYPTVLTIKGE